MTALTWLFLARTQWAYLARVAVLGVLTVGLLLGMHWTIGEPR